MIALELTEKLEKRIGQLAKKTGKTKTFFICEAIEEHILDIEDAYLAVERLKKPGKRYTLAEVEKELGLEH